MHDGGNTQEVLNPIPQAMNATNHIEALALALPNTTTYPDWISVGRSLATSKRHIDWLIGDWINFGRQQFPEQIELALADVADDPRNLKRIEKTARAFPPHLRSSALTFEHHAHVADMPVQDALPLLRQAETEHLPAKALRIRAMLRKIETGQILPREPDEDDDALITLVRAWNRATPLVRADFAELVNSSHLGVIDA